MTGLVSRQWKATPDRLSHYITSELGNTGGLTSLPNQANQSMLGTQRDDEGSKVTSDGQHSTSPFPFYSLALPLSLLVLYCLVISSSYDIVLGLLIKHAILYV